jgi:predicted RNA-binding Zn ribbon-like protein
MNLEDLDWVGGHPAVDFVNTVSGWRGDAPGDDYLADWPSLLRWHRMADLIGPRSSRFLDAGSDRAKAQAVRDAREFRDALHRLFRAVAHGDALPRDALEHLNAMFAKTVQWRRISAEGAEVTCGWNFDGAPPAAILGPVAWQAAELLEHGERGRIKECPNTESCGWLFVDTSRNRSSTWCSMKACGNAAKVRRFRARSAAQHLE